MRCVSAEPARSRSGKAFTLELPTYRQSVCRSIFAMEEAIELQSKALGRHYYSGIETYPRYCMQHSRSSHHQTHSRSPRQISIDASSIPSRLLVPKANELDAKVDCFFCDVHHGYTDNAEDNSDSEATEASCDDLGTCRRRHGQGLTVDCWTWCTNGDSTQDFGWGENTPALSSRRSWGDVIVPTT